LHQHRTKQKKADQRYADKPENCHDFMADLRNLGFIKQIGIPETGQETEHNKPPWAGYEQLHEMQM
jgi:hypothetical protein